MSVYKDEKTNTWKVYYRYTDWQGKVHQTTKRGFQTKREALAWEREQLNKVETDLDMSFESFIDIYTADMKNRIKENTWHTKEHIMRTKILPYFGQRKISDIQPKDILAWQNEMIKATDKQGRPYSPVYLKTLHNQLSAIFNHAVRFYGLKSNPAQKVGNMGKAKGREMLFWTQDEYAKFSFAIMDKPISFYAFEMLYWCGLREGDADGKISLNQQKPSKHAGLRRFGPEKFLQRNNEFMKERPIFYKKPIKTEKDFSTWLRCFYYTTKAVITEYIYF